MANLSDRPKRIVMPGQYILLESPQEYDDAANKTNESPYDIRFVKDENTNKVYITFFIGNYRWAIEAFSGKYCSKMMSEEFEK